MSRKKILKLDLIKEFLLKKDFIIVKCNPNYFLNLAYLVLNLSTLPAVSTSFALPV